MSGKNGPKVVYRVDADSYGQYMGMVILVGIGLAIAAVVMGFWAIVILAVPLIASTLVAIPNYLMFFYWSKIGKSRSRDDALHISTRLFQDGRLEEAESVVQAYKNDDLVAEWLKIIEMPTMDRIRLAFRLRGFLLPCAVFLMLGAIYPIAQWIGLGLVVTILAITIFQLFRVFQTIGVIDKALEYQSDNERIAYAQGLLNQSKKYYARQILYVSLNEEAESILQGMGQASNYHYKEWYKPLVTLILSILVLVGGVMGLNSAYSLYTGRALWW